MKLEPEMRAAHTQSLLHAVGRLPSGERSAILTAICYVEGLQGCLEATLDICRSNGWVTVLEQNDRGD